MEKVILRNQAAGRIKKGYPMIVKQDYATPPQSKEGDLVELTDQKGQFLAIAYLGKEKRSSGWVVSTQKDQKLDGTFMKKIFEQAKENRKSYFLDEDTNAFRLFNGEGDGLGGMIIDFYNGFALFQWYNKGIYAHRQTILKSFHDVFPMVKGIYEKKRFPTKGQASSDFVTGEKAPSPLIVKENNIRYATYLDDGLMTGIFLDQRHVRRSIMENYAAGSTVLNLFSYTGAFSVAAAMGGATKTVSVDVAKRSLPKTTEQFEVNGLNSEDHEIRIMDVFDYVNYGLRHELTFNLVISDPPTFARTKKRTFSVEKDYEELIEQYIDLTTENGVIVLSTNSWTLSMKEFKQIINRAFTKKNQSYTILEKHGLPTDFAVKEDYLEGEYLKVVFVQKK